RITQEMDDVWANVCAYYDDAEMKEGSRGTGTWMPLGYDFNLSFGQWYYNDVGGTRSGLMSNQDWFKSHPLYGGTEILCHKGETSSITVGLAGNSGFEAIYQSAKFRRLYLRRLRTLMDQELKEPGTAEADTPFMAKMREMAELMQSDAALDQEEWPNDDTDNAIDVWATRPADMDEGINDIWENYVVPRREHLYVTHSVTNTAKEIGYGSNLNAGIPESQSDIAVLAPNITITNLSTEDGYFHDTEVVAIYNGNDEVVDMSGWKLAFSADFTFPAGTVCDANDYIYIVADRRQYIEDNKAALTDEVIVGNATITGTGPIVLYDADGVEVFRMVPETNELNFLRLHSFYGNTLGDGDTGEWFTLTNISDSATLDLAGVTVCFLKQGDPEEGTAHCHVTLENKKGKGSIAPLKSWTASQADYSDKGWEKIQNNKQQITIYDKYGSICQSLKVTQKNFPLAYGNGGYLVCDSIDASVASDSQWHEALYELTNNGASSEPFAANSQEAADELIANATPALSDDDVAAGLEAQYLTIVAEQVEGETGKYKAVVVVNPETVHAPAIAESTTEEDEPFAVEDDADGNKVMNIWISNAVIGLWYGYEVTDALGDGEAFENDVDSFERATGAEHRVSASPREKTKPAGFFRVKALPAKP
ncbi:MAG: lamin tail domain-containing protein, partial [Kiritimatiellae bacterium]|nr:lamin tail domain-containing protein [Kiritimatiellia bacterium]